MNPAKRQQEFRRRLVEKNSAMARRYGSYLDQKAERLTSDDAWAALSYQEIRTHILDVARSNGVELDDTNEFYKDKMIEVDALIVLISGYNKMYKGLRADQQKWPLGYDPMERIGVRNLDDFILLWLKEYRPMYREWLEQTNATYDLSYDPVTNPTELEAMDFEECQGFEELLLNKLGILVENGQTAFGHVWEIFPLGDYSPMTPDDKDYFLKQYRRLEREMALHTIEAERLFLAFLKDVPWDRTNRVAGFKTRLCSFKSLPLTLDELFGQIQQPKDSIIKTIDQLLRYNVRSFISDFDRYVEYLTGDYLIFDSLVYPDGGDWPAEFRGTGEAIARLKREIVDELPIKEIEKRLRWKIGFIESATKNNDVGPEFASRLKDYIARDRFSLYLFNLTRRRRDQLPFDPFSEENQ